MAILVTGGAGFIGSHTVVELQNAGYDVVVVDNLVNASKEALRRVEEITGNRLLFMKRTFWTEMQWKKCLPKMRSNA